MVTAKASRQSNLDTITRGVYDLVVIGGGITGASIFRDAVLRGMRVCLIDAGDFASGTSSRSSKLLHGGFRYLSSGQFGVTFRSCRERDVMVDRIATHAERETFVIPVFAGHGFSRVELGFGLCIYTILAKARESRPHKWLNPQEVSELIPAIAPARGGYRYIDALVNDARLTLDTVLDGVARGGLALNYAGVTKITKRADSRWKVTAQDRTNDSELSIFSSSVINAAGACADKIRRMDDPTAKPLIRRSRGAHLFYDPADIPVKTTVAFKSPLDGRQLFLIRQPGYLLLGTTDSWEDSSRQPDCSDIPYASEAETTYLQESLCSFMPGLGKRPKPYFACCGYRPLVVTTVAGETPGAVSREYVSEVSPSGLFSVMGGKLTTARRAAADAVTRVQKSAGIPVRKKPSTDGIPLLNKTGADRGSADDIATELPCSVEDVVERRWDSNTLTPENRIRQAIGSRRIIQSALGISSGEFDDQLDLYREYLQNMIAGIST